MSERLPPISNGISHYYNDLNLANPVAEIKRTTKEIHNKNNEKEEVSWNELKENSSKAYNSFIESNNREWTPQQFYEKQKNAVGSMLRAWEYANGRFEHYFKNYTPAQGYLDDMAIDFWDYILISQKKHIDTILDREILFDNNIIGIDHFLNIGGTFHILENLIKDHEFKEKEFLVTYLIDQVEVCARNIEDNEEAEKQEKLLKVLNYGLVFANKEKDTDTTRKILSCFRDQKRQDLAKESLLHQDLNETQRKDMMVQYINTFGFVSAVDAVSNKIEELNKIKETSELPDLDTQIQSLKELYSTFQGDKVDEIMETLTSVYEGVDFHKYEVNTKDLTENEINIVEDHVISRFSEKFKNRDPKEIRFVDIAAGTGRHTLELLKRGYPNVTALEYEPIHVNRIKAQNSEANVIRGSWYEMPFGDGNILREEYKPIEGFSILGRSIHHARTPNEMLKIFDELHRITGDYAYGVIDIGREEGEYGDNLERFKKNLKDKNIDTMYAQIVFDGPDNEHRFNRMLMSDKQFRTYASLMGFDVLEVIENKIPGVTNAYYVLGKNEYYSPSSYNFASIYNVSHEEFTNMMRDIGLFDAGTDYDMYIDAWEMTIAQALYYGLDDDSVRTRNALGNPPKVNVTIEKGKVILSPY